MMVYALGLYPEGKYIGGVPEPYFRVEAVFKLPSKRGQPGKVSLRVNCGPKREVWYGQFDISELPMLRDVLRVKNFQTSPTYKQYLAFFNKNCGRKKAVSGQLTTFYFHEYGIDYVLSKDVKMKLSKP